jgi:hypothetical protein
VLGYRRIHGIIGKHTLTKQPGRDTGRHLRHHADQSQPAIFRFLLSEPDPGDPLSGRGRHARER